VAVDPTAQTNLDGHLTACVVPTPADSTPRRGACIRTAGGGAVGGGPEESQVTAIDLEVRDRVGYEATINIPRTDPPIPGIPGGNIAVMLGITYRPPAPFLAAALP
jgi:hypothetical protein